MYEAILVAVITGGLSLVGTVLTVLATSKKTEQAMQVSQAVMDTKIDELTREVREHNGVMHRLPVVEEQIKAVTKRVDDLEQKAG